jgi:TolB-like protein
MSKPGREQELIGKTLAQYTIVEKIGAGGMGEVYRAWDSRLERDVALKVLPPGMLGDDQARKRFRKEALALSKLNHPNIATIHDFNTQDDIDFLVMEYIPGLTLAQTVSGRVLPNEELIDIAIQIVSCLQEAHERGFVHRDLKPANVLVTPKKRVKVLDFGLAQLFRADSDLDATLTYLSDSFRIAGTLPYMSPEQLAGETLDQRCDIYSFGVLLYEMMTGTLPFREKTFALLTDAILRQTPKPPSAINPHVAPWLEGIILKCLEKDREKRYQSAKELGIDLQRVLSSPASESAFPSAHVTTTPVGEPGISRRVLLYTAIGAVVLLAGVLAVTQFDWRGKTTPAAYSAAQIESIVALPAKVFGGQEDAFLTDAIPGSLSTYLAEIRDLETKVPPGSHDFERFKGDVSKVVRAYHAGSYVLTNVAVQAERLSLNVQLVDSVTNRIVWSQEFEGLRREYRRLVRDAADGIRRALRPAAAPLAMANPSAGAELELLLRRGYYDANRYIRQGHPADLDVALKSLEKVLELDPNRAEAAAEIARLHAAGFTAAPLTQLRPKAEEWALKALKIDSRNSKAWAVLAEVEPSSNFGRKLEYALKGATLGPHDAYAHTLLSATLSRSSYVLSLEASRQASRVDPLIIRGAISEGLLLAGLGHREQALSRINSVLSVEPDSPFGLAIKSIVLVLNRQMKEAAEAQPRLRALAGQKRLHPEWVGLVDDLLKYEQARQSGDSRTAALVRSRIVKLAQGEVTFQSWQPITMGASGIFARNGDLDDAVQVMEARNRLGITDTYDYLLFHPDFERIRRTPRFPELSSAARAGFQQMTLILEQARVKRELPSYLDRPLADILQRVKIASGSVN